MNGFSLAFCPIIWKWQVAQLQRHPFLFSWNLFGLKHHLILDSLTFAINTLEYYYLWMYYGDFQRKSLFDGGEWIHSWSNSIFPLTMAARKAHAHAYGGNNVPWNNMFNIYFYCTNGFSYRIGPFLYTHTHAPRQQFHTACQMRMKSTKYTHPPPYLPREQTKCKCYIYQTLKMKRIALDKGHTHLWHYSVARGDSCYWNGDDKCEWFFVLVQALAYAVRQRMGKQNHNNQ